MSDIRPDFLERISAARKAIEEQWPSSSDVEDVMRTLADTVSNADEFRAYLELLWTHGKGISTEYPGAIDYLSALWGNMDQWRDHYKDLEAKTGSPWAVMSSAILNSLNYE